MKKLDALKEIFNIENISHKIKSCPRITEEILLKTLAKNSYKLNEELNISYNLVGEYLKILFPERPINNSKVDNWLLLQYGLKQCKNCNEVKELELFSANKSRNDRVNSHCKECHHKNTVEYQREYQRFYKALKISRCPIWANREIIKEIYKNCPQGYDVDHIIPLQGQLVSGLHIETNLQYLLHEINCSKGNKFIVE